MTGSLDVGGPNGAIKDLESARKDFIEIDIMQRSKNRDFFN